MVSFADVDSRHSADHSIDRDSPRLLKLLDRALSRCPEDAVNAAGIVTQSVEGLLKVLTAGSLDPFFSTGSAIGVSFCREMNPTATVGHDTVAMTPRLKREHATHKGLPGNGTNDAVYCDRWNAER